MNGLTKANRLAGEAEYYACELATGACPAKEWTKDRIAYLADLVIVECLKDHYATERAQCELNEIRP